MRLSMEDKPTTLPGVIMSFILTVGLWIGAFVAAYNFGLAVSGSDIGGAAATICLFIVGGNKFYIRTWTR